MAGRKQHYIPQCLLRQFAAKQTRKSTQVVVYRRGQSPFLTATDGIAAKRDFYSASATPGSHELDDEITAYENRLAPMLESLRNVDASTAIDPRLAAEAVAHLTVRGAFIRDFFVSACQDIVELLASSFSSEDSSRSILGIDDYEPRDVLKNAIDEAYAELPAAVSGQFPKPLFGRLGSVLARENFEDIFDAFAPQMEPLLARFRHELPLIARRGHVKALGKGMAPDERLNALAALTWTVRTFSRYSLILPDCVALAELPDGSLGPFQIQENEKLVGVLLPLSDQSLLVGRHNGASPFCGDAQDFNRFASASCWDFFVASFESEQLNTLAAGIGRHPRSFLNASINDVKNDFLASHGGLLAATPGIGAYVASEDIDNHPLSVSFLGCANQEQAEKVAGMVASIVQAVGRHFPLNRLETVTFAYDYVGALKDLDRGHPQLKAETPTEDSCGVGVAMAPLVVREGQIRVCVIAKAWLSGAMLDETHDAHSTAIHTLVTMIARVAFVELLDTSLPGTLLQPLPDLWDVFLFPHIESICSAYFSARVAAPCAPDMGDGYRTLFCDVLARADLEIPKERLSYRTHGNLDEFLHKLWAMVDPVLVHCATLIGHFDGIEESPFDDEGKLSAALQSASLGRWFDVYGRDLRRNHGRIGAWASLKEFLFLTAHVERHLWRYGVFPWRTNEGTVRVEIPLATDAAALRL